MLYMYWGGQSIKNVTFLQKHFVMNYNMGVVWADFSTTTAIWISILKHVEGMEGGGRGGGAVYIETWLEHWSIPLPHFLCLMWGY